MIKFEFRKGDMLKNMNTEDIFVHACNCKGVWGRGIAKQFKSEFSDAFEQYRNFCMMPDTRPGDACIVEERGYQIGCLITSNGYGKLTDDPKKIIVNTHRAVIDLLDQIKTSEVRIQSNVFNSGLFGVPWKHTQKVLERIGLTTQRDIYWTVWDL